MSSADGGIGQANAFVISKAVKWSTSGRLICPFTRAHHVEDVAIAEGVRARRVHRLKIELALDKPRGDLGDPGRRRAFHLPMDAGNLHAQGNAWHGERVIRLAEQALAMARERVVVPVDEVLAVLCVDVIAPVDEALRPALPAATALTVAVRNADFIGR